MILTALSVLAEPTRIDAMRLPADGTEHCLCDLMQKLDATPSRMSRPMQILKQAGPVVDRRDARWARYRISADPSQPVARMVEAALGRQVVVRETTA